MRIPTLELPNPTRCGDEPASACTSTALRWQFEDIACPDAQGYDNPVTG
ncbi:hypothetical protein [Deinococcus ruber]|nr:hypothetical protein [Deinococcus ruber]